MANTIDASLSETTGPMRGLQGKHAVSRLWSRIALGAVLLLSVFMNFFQLGQNGYGNLYYAAGVKSMGDNWQNFFFVSFDPGGFVTIDKPPLGFWLQVLSTKIFGFSAFSIFFPQALCGVLAVLLLYYLVPRHFGVVAGLLAALALAISPISVVTNRNNTIDGTLALALLLAAWAVIHAAETGKLRWLLLSAVFVGLGFNIKMAEAYLVVPALVMTYLLCAPRKIWTRIWHLALFAVVVFALSISWLLAVDLTPIDQRPYVGSTQTNSELSLAFGYNGLNRVRIGGNGIGGNRAPARNTRTNPDTSRTGQNRSSTDNTANPENPANPPQPPQGGGMFFESVAPSLFRLFSVSLGGQIAWLLPFALLAILALAWQRRFHFQQDRQQLALVLWGMWLLTMATFFTLDGAFHQYYMTEMAPGLSALVGIGLVIMWKDYRSGGWRGWLLPLALIVTAAAQIYILMSYPAWSQWLSPLIGILTALVVIALIVLRLRPQLKLSASTMRIAISIGMFTLLITPTIWSGYSVIHNTESAFPTAGPPTRAGIAGFFSFPGIDENSQRTGAPRAGVQNIPVGSFDETTQTNAALISYLEANQGNAKFLVAVPNANAGASIILATNKPVMAMGGFSGNDPILTTTDLQNLISNGTVRFFLINSPRSIQQMIDQLPEQFREALSGQDNDFPGGFGGFTRQNTLSTWISQHCSVVPAKAWQTSSGNAGMGGNQLYDCAGFHS
jgi:4-amino-4-deoxy-L-arabinose transferase-like glycosyltransferase